MNLPEFEHTVATCQHRLFGYALRLLANREEAADVAQDSFLKLWGRRDEVEVEGAAGWLVRVTRNACIDLIRRRKLEHELFQVETDPSAIATGRRSPEQEAEASSLRTHLDRAFDRLSEPYRSIVILREIEDFRYEEIAGALDLPMTTVKVYLHRGRKKLRSIIQEELHGELV